MPHRQVDTIWCDDIRQEVGGKLAFIGVYQTQLIASSLPITLPKLCVLVKVRSPIDKLPSSMTIQVRKNEGDQGDPEADETLQEIKVPDEDLASAMDALKASGELPPTDDNVDRWQLAQFALTLSPLQLDTPSLLRVVVYVDDEELRGPGLQVTEAEKTKSDGD